jgi:hypothetical protein
LSNLDGWTLTNPENANVFGSCGYYSTIGGYGISAGTSTVLSKNNIGLSGHYRVKILVDVLFIRSWDNESFFMEVDGIKVISHTHPYS